MNKKDLWLRLKAYHFNHLVPPHLWIKVTAAFGREDASTKAFADKISRKLEWKHRFALRAIREYKKFIYLGAVSDFVVTPSKIIDQVWHEHLLFTKAYRDFCSDVPGFSFDRNSGAHSRDQTDRLHTVVPVTCHSRHLRDRL